MRGQILATDAAGGGVIAGADGNRYTFSPLDWKGVGAPPGNADVDFIAREGVAAEIFPLPVSGAGLGVSSAATAAAVRPPQRDEGSSMLLGVIGIICLVLSFVIPLVPLIVAFILGLIGADSAKRYNNGSGLVASRIAWIGAVVLFVAGVLLLLALLFFAWPLVALIWFSIMDEIAKAGMTSALFAL